MNDKLPLREESDCLSELALDLLLCCPEEPAEALRSHLAACARCRLRFEALEAEARTSTVSRDAQLAALRCFQQAGRGTLSAPPAAWSSRRVWLPLAAAAGIALALGIGVAVAPPPDLPSEGAIRLKAPFALTVLVREPGGARPLLAGERLKPGAVLGFEVASPVLAQVFLAGLSESSEAYPILPEGKSAFEVQAGTGIGLPVKATLDAAPSDERIFALFCAQKQDAATLLAALDTVYTPGPDGRKPLGRDPPDALAGCPLRSVLVRKASGP